MEKIIVTLLMGLLFSLTGNAQENFEEEMVRAFGLWEQGKPEEAAEQFEEIAAAGSGNWLPYYYASYVRTVTSFESSDPAAKIKNLEEAQVLLDEAARITGEEVEILLLQAMLHMAYVASDPMTHGGQLSPVIQHILEKVAEKEPENPRLALIRVEWNMGSAGFFGEDPTKNCGDLEASLKLFEEEKPIEIFAPDWGEERARYLLDSTCAKRE